MARGDRRRGRVKTVFLRRTDGVIQRYKVRWTEDIPPEKLASKSEFEEQKRSAPPVTNPQRKRRSPFATPKRQNVKGRVPEHLLGYKTFFRAAGQSIPDQDLPGQETEFLLDNPPEKAPNSPGAFFSASALGGLGQVMWKGLKPLDEIIAELNRSLNLPKGEDFRSVYVQWSYRYHIEEVFDGRETGVTVTDIRRSSRGPGR